MNCLVTGGAGFIGSNLTARLLKKGHRVRVLDNLSTGRMENMKEFLSKIQFLKGDLQSTETVQKAVEGIEVVFHQAAIPSVPRSLANPLASNETNVTGTLNLLVAACDAGVRRVVYASSSSLYGNSPHLPKREDMAPAPLSPYAVSKYAGELYLKVFCEVYGLEGVSLRYFNVFGPGQDPDSQYAAVIPRFITAVLNGGEPVIFGDGEQSRDFTYIDNAVEANLLAMSCPRAAGEAVNIACGEQVSLNTMVSRLGEIAGRNIKPEHLPPRPGDVRHSLADLSRAGSLLNYRPLVDFNTGLKKLFAWFVENGV
ncbi:MAG: SDR family oxidoreductase [Peptococcaceae bacterium]|nr:MAG: SDR family oxidoreductase [Peptococcaceae bacterium]